MVCNCSSGASPALNIARLGGGFNFVNTNAVDYALEKTTSLSRRAGVTLAVSHR
jgi:hypothetical protein